MSERERDAYVAQMTGWRAFKERRGEYNLCVVVAPGARMPWEKGQTPDPERYTEVTCLEAAKIGFYGTGFPKFTSDHSAAYEVEEKIREEGLKEDYAARLARLCLSGLIAGRYLREMFAVIHASPDSRCLAAVQAKEVRMTDKACATCEFWTQTGMEDSGIKAVDGSGNWFYAVGDCTRPENRSKEWKRPSWCGCHLHKPAKWAKEART
jgi:hypothetical protein